MASTPNFCAMTPGGIPGAHNYQPRYDEKTPDPFWNVLREQNKDRTYVGDVCSHCGHYIARSRK